MPDRHTDRFLYRLANRLAEAGLRRARPSVSKSSKSLAGAMQAFSERADAGTGPGAVKGVIEVPHFWAVFVHDGRGPFSTEGFMVWWRNPKNDPRLSGTGGRTPRRVSELRQLSRDEFLRALEIRDRHIQLTGDPYTSPVIITKEVRKPTPPNRFFSNEEGMRGFAEDAGRIGAPLFTAHVKDELRRVAGGKLFEQDSVKAVL